VDRKRENPYVEPAHDFLVKSWDKLQKWQQEELQNLSLQRRLTPAAEEWKNIKDKEKQPNSLAKTWEQAESVAMVKYRLGDVIGSAKSENKPMFPKFQV
jgi:hypothetical protein